jgi:O-acetylhomoserine/O-acetylserine sulfhydrylase-like pyridoxal-dependent enzyme
MIDNRRYARVGSIIVMTQPASGVTPGYVRLPIGIEHCNDILADIGQALSCV